MWVFLWDMFLYMKYLGVIFWVSSVAVLADLLMDIVKFLSTKVVRTEN